MEKVFTKKEIMNRRIFEQEEENNDVNIKKSEDKVNGSFVDIVSGILHSRTQIHIYHLQTKSFAVHKALNDYYDGVVGIFDGLVESYQGKHGIIENYKCDGYDNYSSVNSAIEYLQKLDKGACVEFKKIGDFWYILSSDGLKNS